jgi:hypothetical protein
MNRDGKRVQWLLTEMMKRSLTEDEYDELAEVVSYVQNDFDEDDLEDDDCDVDESDDEADEDAKKIESSIGAKFAKAFASILKKNSYKN